METKAKVVSLFARLFKTSPYKSGLLKNILSLNLNFRESKLSSPDLKTRWPKTYGTIAIVPCGQKPKTKNQKLKTISASILTFFLLIESNFATAQVLFDKWDIIKSGMNIWQLSETKINNIEKYLLQNWNSGNSTTLFEADTNNILELNNIYKTAYNLTNTGVKNYNFNYGKALFDGNIAIVDLATSNSGRYTYEAPYYCDLLISSLAKFVKIGNNICLSSYAQFMQQYAINPNRTYVNIIKAEEFKTADLSKYAIVIFPDIILGKHAEILDELTGSGIANIKNFVNNWWVTYFSSKSLILSDKMELTNKVVDDNILVKHHLNQGKIKLTNASDFNSQILNFWMYEWKNYSSKVGSWFYDYLLGSYYIKKNEDPSVVPVRYFDIANDSAYYFQDVNTSENSELDVADDISAFYKPYGKGYILYNWWSSLFSPQSNSHKLFINHTVNNILFSFLREIYTTTKIVQKSNTNIQERLIPALEKDIVFEYNFEATNVFNQAQSNLVTRIKIASWWLILDSSLPTDCQIENNNTGSIICNKLSLTPGEKWNINFKLKVIEPNFSQAGLNIQVTNTTFNYKNSNNLDINQNIWDQTVDSLQSANLRTSLNLDPGWYYPLPWPWVYVDQVVNTENKWSTESIETNYSAIVPLISPIFEESDQARLVSKLVFSKDYHNNLYNQATKTNYYPFKNTWDCAVTDLVLPNRCKDYVIPSLLPTGYFYVDNYDEPVFRQWSDDIEAATQINPGLSNADLWRSILRQSFLPDADKLFMHAKPRRMVRNYPTKKELLFARQDIYFYENPAFPLPKWITSRSQFITMDKYAGWCDKIPGTYGYPNWVIAGKYGNELICNKVPWVNNKLDRDNLPAGIEKTDYLFPVDPKNNITNIGDLEGFDNDWNYIWVLDENSTRSQSYPFKFIKWSFVNFYLPPRSTTKGWIIEFDLPGNINPSAVYVLADHIAVSKIDRNGQNVKIYFYRGRMPNEQTLKSIVGVALEWVNEDIANITFKINALKYDLSNPSQVSQYDFEQNVVASFSKYQFLKMPAVKLNFELPRRKRISTTNIESQNLTDGQINVIFIKPEYYSNSLVFKKNTVGEVTTLLNQAGLTADQKTAILNIFQGTTTESYLRKRENMEPFVRFGTYIQELAFHRTVWWIAEDHPINDPWIMVDQAMFGNVGVVGINPIPFREYLTTGKFQVMPLAKENSRVDYKDIFWRQFSSPIRTVLPEAVPLPPPVRDFQMNTTFEMYDKDWNRKDTWNNEDELEIRQNIKLYNNYPKFFDPTLCVDNKSDTLYYWKCYNWNGTNTVGYSWQTNYVLADKNLDNIDLYWVNNVKLFNSKNEYSLFMSGLTDMLTASWLADYTVSTLNRAQDGKWNISLIEWEKIDDKAHNYSPEVEKHYPENYIKNNMWNLTHYDYDDSVYSKGYPYHMDNQIPNPNAEDFWNPAKYLPHNIIALPIFKWVGYKMKYFSEEIWYTRYEVINNGKIENNITPYTSRKYPQYKWWWSENLQNKDSTLLAGQDKTNEIPYEYKQNWEYLKDDLINASNFDSTPTNNIYSCLFNPRTLKDNPNKFLYKANVVLNNVIPIIPWIQKENEFANYLTNYSCTMAKTYDNSNLNKINNIVETEDAYWMYFGSNLRWWAKESFNVINRLTPYPGTKFEWDLKIVEWWRFVYWNPAFGPNAFQIVDNNVTVIKSVRSELEVQKELIPYNLKNYKTDAYLLYTVKDPWEISIDGNGKETPRKWKDEIYIDSRGGWNFSSSVYVGSSYNWQATKSLLDPGDKTLVRLDLYNNSWYDWDLLGSGTIVNDNWQYKTYINGWIDFTIAGRTYLNATDIMNKVARNVLKPDKFNFLEFVIPDEIKDYVTIKPSDANMMTPGTFFDFDFVNVTTIRDGFKWSYFVDLEVKPTIPDVLRAKVYNIKVNIKPEYFNHLPWVVGKDPVNWPNMLTIPDLRFALADADNNAFFISWQSSDINLEVNYNSWFTFDKAYEITEEWLDALRLAAWDGTNKHRRLRETWQNMANSGYILREFTPNSLGVENGLNKLNINFAAAWITKFPYTDNNGKIIAKTYIVTHLTKDSLDDGERLVEWGSTINYSNDSWNSETSENTTQIKWYAQWPKLDISYYSSLVGQNKQALLEIQKLTEWENTIEVKLFLKNTGTDVAFDPTIKVNVAPWVTINNAYTTWATIVWNEVTIKNFYTMSWEIAEWEAVGPGITNYFPIYLSYSWTYSENPINLVNNASYEFTPYDTALPAMSGSYSTWFYLEFAKTSVNIMKGTVPSYSLSFSWNTTGIYWDLVEQGNNIFSKLTETGSEFLTQNIDLDPTITHNLTAISYFKTKNWDFKKISEVPLVVLWEDPYINLKSTSITNGKKLLLNLETNKLGQFGWQYQVTSTQGDYLTGLIATTSSGWLLTLIDNVDVSTGTSVNVSLYSSGNYLTGTNLNIPGEWNRLYNMYATRQSTWILLNFTTNKVLNNCFKVKRNGRYISNVCQNIEDSVNTFLDSWIDNSKEQIYGLEILDKTSSSVLLSGFFIYIPPTINTSSIPLKILQWRSLKWDINFSKVKDLGDTYIMDETPVQYLVRFITESESTFSQLSQDESVEIVYASWQIIYAWENWDKILSEPTIKDENWKEIIELWDSNTPLLFSDINLIIIHNIWDKPDKLEMEHNWITYTIPECWVNFEGTCRKYDINKVKIFTKKFSKFIIHPKVTPNSSSSNISSSWNSWWWSVHVVVDNCPTGDDSPSYYDNSCKKIVDKKSQTKNNLKLPTNLLDTIDVYWKLSINSQKLLKRLRNGIIVKLLKKTDSDPIKTKRLYKLLNIYFSKARIKAKNLKEKVVYKYLRDEFGKRY